MVCDLKYSQVPHKFSGDFYSYKRQQRVHNLEPLPAALTNGRIDLNFVGSKPDLSLFEHWRVGNAIKVSDLV